MAPEGTAEEVAVPPDRMTVAAARFFASDWELSSFHEFFLDLALRSQSEVGEEKPAERLKAHAQLALQTLVVRMAENFIAFLDELEGLIKWSKANQDTVERLLYLPALRSVDTQADTRPAELRTELWRHGNSWRLAEDFCARTNVLLFHSADEAERLSRLVTIRNVIQHNRALVTEDLSALIADHGGGAEELRLGFRSVRQDLVVLRTVVARTDGEAAARWQLSQPVEREAFYGAIQSAISGQGASPSLLPRRDSAAG